MLYWKEKTLEGKYMNTMIWRAAPEKKKLICVGPRMVGDDVKVNDSSLSSAQSILSSFRSLQNAPTVERKMELIDGLIQMDVGEFATIHAKMTSHSTSTTAIINPEVSQQDFVNRYRRARRRKFVPADSENIPARITKTQSLSVYGNTAYQLPASANQLVKRPKPKHKGTSSLIDYYMNLSQ
jgi:hypothetical protein